MSGCGGENGYQFSKIRDKIKKLPFVDKTKVDKLYYDIELYGCSPHDDAFDEGGGIIAFLRANYNFSLTVIGLLHWTSIIGRLSVFLSLFFGTSIFGIKYFNWKK